jgi:superfamily II DNA or RNA helicase
MVDRQEGLKSTLLIKQHLDAIDDLFSLSFILGAEGVLQLVVVPFLGFETKPVGIAADEKLRELLSNPSFQKAMSSAGLARVAKLRLSMPILQTGIHKPAPRALARSIEVINSGQKPAQSKLLRKRLLKALKAASSERVESGELSVALFEAKSDRDPIDVFVGLQDHCADYFDKISLRALNALSAFDKLVSRCLAANQLVTVSGLEAFVLEHHPRLLQIGYKYLNSSSVSNPLKRIYQKIDATKWQVASLESKASPHVFMTPEGGSLLGWSLTNKTIRGDLGLNLPCIMQVEDEFVMLSRLETRLIRSLDDCWGLLPHLESDADKQVFREASVVLACVARCRTWNNLAGSKFWLARFALHRTILGFERNFASLDQRMSFLKAREKESALLQLCVELLPTNSSTGCKLLLTRGALRNEELQEDEVTVEPGCDWPEYDLDVKKDADSLDICRHRGSIVSESGRFSISLRSLAEGCAFQTESLPENNQSAFDPHWRVTSGLTLSWGRLQMIAGALATAERAPALFGNLCFLREGRVRCSESTLAKAISDEFLVDRRKLVTSSSRNRRKPQFGLRTEPFLLATGRDPRGFELFTERLGTPNPLSVVDVQRQEKTRLKVTYLPRIQSERVRQIFGASADANNAESWSADAVLRLLNDLARKIKEDKIKTSDQKDSPAPSGYEELIGEFGSIELEPRFEFEIGEQVVSQTEWEAAKKLKDGYLVCGRIYLTKTQYEACLDVYILRKKALARFSKIRVVDLWRSLGTFGASKDSSLQPAEYLEQLQINLEPILELMNKAIPETILAELDEPSSTLARDLHGLNGQLRQYQKYGTAWLLSRVDSGLGALLADDMGLGKTVQATALLIMLRRRELRKGRVFKPVLIVCPKSLMVNWNHELKRFLPSCDGSPSNNSGFRISTLMEGEIDRSADIVVTTYHRLRIRYEELAQSVPEWGLVVLDEAHTIKNSGTQIAQSVSKLVCEKRVALTGTPIENHARELWSIVDWLNPGLLGKESEFDAYTRLARTSAEKRIMLAPVHEILKPILLRRLKSDPAVGLELPEKIYKTIRVELTEEQRILYETIVLAAINADVGAENSFQAGSRFITATLRLKQICNHPDLFWSGDEENEILNNPESLGHVESKKLRALIKQRSLSACKASSTKKQPNLQNFTRDFIERSSKFEALIGLLDELQECDGGILVFTQFRRTAEHIQRVLGEHSPSQWTDVTFLHGGLSTTQRYEIVSRFQDRCGERRALLERGEAVDCSPPLLIISLRAGGMGLNLTGATQVIHFDRWWNPSVEDQATDRAHRIGQQQTVVVTHFCSEGTIEEGLMVRLNEKRSLANDLIGMASQESFGESMQNVLGFLKLADPYGNFRGRARVSSVTSRFRNANQGFVETTNLNARDRTGTRANGIEQLENLT